MSNKTLNKDLFTMCLPSSLERWKKRNYIADKPGTRYGDKNDVRCDVHIPELSKVSDWDELNKQILEDKKVFSKFPKVATSLYDYT